LLLMCGLLVPACQAPRGPVSVHSDDPDLQILAIKDDARLNDRKDLATMVSDLRSDDPAIRFYAIEALRRLTHSDFGYRYYESDDQRAHATALWQQWLKQQPKPLQPGKLD
jgi:hypothetical protein